MRRFEKIDEVDAEERVRQRALSRGREPAGGSLRRDQFGDVAVECLRRCAEYPTPSDADVLIIYPRREWQDDLKRCWAMSSCVLHEGWSLASEAQAVY